MSVETEPPRIHSDLMLTGHHCDDCGLIFITEDYHGDERMACPRCTAAVGVEEPRDEEPAPAWWRRAIRFIGEATVAGAAAGVVAIVVALLAVPFLSIITTVVYYTWTWFAG